MGAVTLPAFVHRNPRYTILLIFVLVCSSLLLIPGPVHMPPAMSPSKYVDYIPSKFRSGGQSLEEWVRREEAHYAEVLKGRRQLIQKYGPDPARVDP